MFISKTIAAAALLSGAASAHASTGSPVIPEYATVTLIFVALAVVTAWGSRRSTRTAEPVATPSAD